MYRIYKRIKFKIKIKIKNVIKILIKNYINFKKILFFNNPNNKIN